jgi:glycosyltransferase involved in cell wall biosynthesis
MRGCTSCSLPWPRRQRHSPDPATAVPSEPTRDHDRRPLAIAHTESSDGWGGQEIRILTEAAGMQSRGHRVVVHGAHGSRIVAEAPRFGVPAVAMPIARKRPAGVIAMRRALHASPFDIVNTHSSTDTWLAAVALRLPARARPILVRTRHVSVPVPNDAATRWLYRKATRRLITTGESLRATLIRDNGIDPERIESIPTGIDGTRFAPGDTLAARAALNLPRDVPLIGIVATLRSWKGHRYLLDAVTRLAARDARLVIVGDGPQREALEAQVDAVGLRARVVFAGQQDDVAPWLRALDVFALPSYANEGVPQALLQAMFTGVPCVTTDAGAIPEIARHGETALVVAREDSGALAAGLDTLLADAALRQRLAATARAYVVPRFGLPAMLDRMEAAFRRALADAGSP